MYSYRWTGRRFPFPLIPVLFALFVLIMFVSHPVLFLAVPLAIVALAFFSARCGGWRGGNRRQAWHDGWNDGEKPKSKRTETATKTGSVDGAEIHYF